VSVRHRPRDWTGFSNKTLWDGMELLGPLILSVAILVAGNQFTEKRLAFDRQLDESRKQDAVLQAYLDRTERLLLEQGLREASLRSEVRQIARTRTLVALRQLDGARRGELVRFLADSELLGAGDVGAVVSLEGADLSGAELSGADLEVVMRSGANLGGADLRGANLREADLSWVNLDGANVKWADLRGANLEGARLSGTDLQGADLSGANLKRTSGLSQDQLDATRSYKDTDLPPGLVLDTRPARTPAHSGGTP